MGKTARPRSSGRRATPTALKLVDGTATVDVEGVTRDTAGRVIPDAPEFHRGAPERPDTLSADAAWMWDRVTDQMTRVGLLKPLDGPSLEVACETFARWRDAVRQRHNHGSLGKNSQGVVAAPWVGIEERASREFRSWCAEYGMTPAAERALARDAGVPDDDNPF